MTIDRFGKGTPTFKCELCGKLTRQTGSNAELCSDCYKYLEEENAKR